MYLFHKWEKKIWGPLFEMTNMCVCLCVCVSMWCDVLHQCVCTSYNIRKMRISGVNSVVALHRQIQVTEVKIFIIHGTWSVAIDKGERKQYIYKHIIYIFIVQN